MERKLTQFFGAMVGGITSVIPYGQPVLGMAGQIASAGIEHDTDNPDATYDRITGALTAGAAAALNDRAEEIEDKANPKMTDRRIAAKARANDLRQIGDNLGPAVGGIVSASRGLKITGAEMEQELARVRASSPAYQDITANLENLNQAKTQVFSQMAAATQALSSNYSRIASNSEAISNLTDKVADESAMMDHTALQFVADMAARAKETLNFYQYTMVKAYEAVTLEPFKGADFRLVRVFEKIRDLVTDDVDKGVIPSDRFEALQGIFSDVMVQMIRTLLSNLEIERTATVWVPLSQEDTPQLIKELNETGETTINLMEMGYIQPDYENVRIESITISDDEYGIVLDSGATRGTVNLAFTPSGDGTVRKDGILYALRHPTNSGTVTYGDTQIGWGVNYNVERQKLKTQEASVAFIDRLQYLLGDQTSVNPAQAQYLAMPAAWTDIIISKRVQGSEINVNGLGLVFRLTYTNASINERVLYVRTRGGHLPLIAVDQKDLSERQHGYGNFYRVYPANSAVTLMAPKTYGLQHFDHWHIIDAETLRTERIDTPKATFELNDSLYVQLVYSDSVSPELTIGGKGRVISDIGNNVRSEPSIDARIIGAIPHNAIFEVLDGPQAKLTYTWWQIRYKGIVGWTAEGFGDDFWLEPVGESHKSNGKGGVVTTDSLNVRDRASVAGNRVGRLTRGTSFKIEDGPQENDGYTWWRIRTDGIEGWVAQGPANQPDDLWIKMQ